jgi:hypothetical protein
MTFPSSAARPDAAIAAIAAQIKPAFKCLARLMGQF